MSQLFDTKLLGKAAALVEILKQNDLMIATAESCTGGLLSGLITEISGCSTIFDRGFITYSNQAKNKLLGVSNELLEKFGAVSPEVAKAMAEGAIKHSNADIAVSVTGIAGPTGGSLAKPVGLVYIGWARKSKEPSCTQFNFIGDRTSIRIQTVSNALEIIYENI